MLKFIKTATLSALIGLGGLTAMPASASADSLHLSLGGPAAPVFSVQFDRRGDERRFDRRGCSAREAVRKAERMGLRRAHVRSENRRVIRVAGRVRGGMDVITFANARGCPVVR